MYFRQTTSADMRMAVYQEDLEDCPYFKEHKHIKGSKFGDHLMRCAKNDPNVPPLVICPFNSFHRVKDLSWHVNFECSDVDYEDLLRNHQVMNGGFMWPAPNQKRQEEVPEIESQAVNFFVSASEHDSRTKRIASSLHNNDILIMTGRNTRTQDVPPEESSVHPPEIKRLTEKNANRKEKSESQAESSSTSRETVKKDTSATEFHREEHHQNREKKKEEEWMVERREVLFSKGPRIISSNLACSSGKDTQCHDDDSVKKRNEQKMRHEKEKNDQKKNEEGERGEPNGIGCDGHWESMNSEKMSLKDLQKLMPLDQRKQSPLDQDIQNDEEEECEESQDDHSSGYSSRPPSTLSDITDYEQQDHQQDEPAAPGTTRIRSFVGRGKRILLPSLSQSRLTHSMVNAEEGKVTRCHAERDEDQVEEERRKKPSLLRRIRLATIAKYDVSAEKDKGDIPRDEKEEDLHVSFASMSISSKCNKERDENKT